MREDKLKFTPDSSFHIDWLINYRIFRAFKSGSLIRLIISRKHEKPIIKYFSKNSRMMNSAKKSYYDLFSHGTSGYPIDGGDFEGGVHHRFGTFTTERESWRKSDDGLNDKEIMKDNIDAYRKKLGLPPVKWKGNK